MSAGNGRDVEPLVTLFDEAPGEPLPLPPELLALHGPLRMPVEAGRPHVFANFVASLDGIVAIAPPRGTGAEISGGDPRDRAVMGLLRAVADAVVVSAGNLRAEGDHLWTPERVCPELAGAYAALRRALGKPPAPLHLVVTGSGDVDLARPVFSGVVPVRIVSSPRGAERLRARGGPAPPITAYEGRAGWIPLAAVLEAARLGPGARVLVESGPTSTTRYLAEHAVDELFLTRAPILVGRAAAPETLGLVDGGFFAAGTARGRLLSVRRGGDFLLTRYALG